MYIAVLIYGRIHKCAEHYENIVKSLGEDNHIDFFLSSDNSPDSLLNEFIRLYKPLSYNNNAIHYDYDLGKYPGRPGEVHIGNMTCHFINKNRVFTLLEEYMNKNNTQYDCVVSLRVDCIFKKKLSFHNLKDNTIYIPAGEDHGLKGVNDQIAYGKLDVMRKYNSINPVDLLEKKLSIPHPETLNLANILFHNLNIERPCIEYYLERMIRLHLPAIPYTITRPEFSHDAFTGKVLRFPRAMMSRGFEVYHYGVETSETGATKQIELMTKEEWMNLRLESIMHLDKKLTREEAIIKNNDPTRVISELSNWSTPLAKEFNRRFREKLGENYRGRKTDIVCLPLGRMHEAGITGLSCTAVETGIGYSGSFTDYRIFEAYSWMSRTLGVEKKQPHNYWFVVPHAFDIDEFKLSLKPVPKRVGFLGRITTLKGCGIIKEIAKRFPDIEFILCGQGDPAPFLDVPNIIYKPPIHGEERSDFLGSCVAFLHLAKYLEPFGCGPVEAQLCGTPVICSDWGGMAETVEQGRTGIRGHTVADYCHGVQMALDGKFDRSDIRKRAAELFDMYKLAARYEYIFKTILDIYTPGKNGWYSPDTHIAPAAAPAAPAAETWTERSIRPATANNIRLHVPAIPYTITRPEYSHDAYTGKVLRFPKAMMSRGFEVYHYGVETSQTGATKHIDLMSKEEWTNLRIKTWQFLNPTLTLEEATKKNEDQTNIVSELSNWNSPLTLAFNARFREKLKENHRGNKTDIVCIPLVKTYEKALEGLGYTVVESGIGYEGSKLAYRIFESYAWMSRTLGVEDKQPSNYWFVIPNFFDTSEFKLSLSPVPKRIGFLGRLTGTKGCGIIVEIAKRFPHVQFILCGSGNPKDYLTQPNIVYKEPIHGEERSEYLGSCTAVLCLSKFLEPFCGVAVEAQLCGTPVICSDWGGMAETVEQGRTGIRGHTIADYCYGVQMALDGKFDRSYIRKRAADLFDMYKLAANYEYALKTILDVHTPGKNGWYSPDTHIRAILPAKKRIFICIPYYGAFPNYFQLYLDSAGMNADILAVILITDIDTSSYTVPANVFVYKMPRQDVQKRAAKFIKDVYDKTIAPEEVLKDNYKFVDFKIVYPILFADMLKELGAGPQDFVGWGDIDLIYGKLSNFIRLEEGYGILGGWHGHFTAIVNDEEFKYNFKTIPNYLELITDNSKTFITDEIAYREPLKAYLARKSIKVFYTNAHFCDIVPPCFFHLSRPDHAKYTNNFYDLYNAKKSIEYFYYDKEKSNLSVKYDTGETRDVLYCHLQKRKMALPFLSYEKGYYIQENSFDTTNIKTYAQLGQDTDVIGYYKCKRGGYFVEIGAYDGIKFSNTYLLEKHYDWNGICVEPLPDAFNALKKNRTKSNCTDSVIYSEAGKNMAFDVSLRDGMFSGISEYILSHKRFVDSSKKTLNLKTTTLTHLLHKFHAPSFIEYLSLGIEGGEWEALRSFDFQKYTFGLINIKHNFLEPLRTDIRKLLTSHNYVYVKENKWVDYYRHASVSVFIHRLNVCPVIHDTIHRLGAKKGSIVLRHRLDNRPVYNKDAFNVFVSSEPEEPASLDYDMYILPFVSSLKGAIYYPFLYMALAEMRCKEFPSTDKTKFCAFMYHKDYEHRNMIFRKIHGFKSVDALGKASNNVAIENSRYTYTENNTFYDVAVKMYSEYKFVISVENCWKEGYFTEKILMPILAHSIPLYWGHPSVFQYINKERVIYLPDYKDDAELFSYLQKLMDNKAEYDKIINRPMYTRAGEPSAIQAVFENDLLRNGLEKDNTMPLIYYSERSTFFCEQRWLEYLVGKPFTFYKHTDLVQFDKGAPVILLYQGFVKPKDVEDWLGSYTEVKPFLFHLSDEFCDSDISIYKHSAIKKVFRNYWRPGAISEKTIHLPLGYYKFDTAESKPLSERPYTWSFAGAMDRPKRKEILSVLEGLNLTSKIHKTPTFGSKADLSESDYLNLLRETKLVPCLPGFANAECFRFYESLECGAMPVVYIDEKKSYENILKGPATAPILGLAEHSWNRVKDVAEDSETLVRGHAKIQQWWKDHKEYLKSLVRGVIFDDLVPAYLTESPIPKKIWQTWETLELPGALQSCVEEIKQQNPDFEHFLVDAAGRRAFIAEHFPKEFVVAYDCLKPGSYKADFWRFCVLYIHGGIYIDIKMKFAQGFTLDRLIGKESFISDGTFLFEGQKTKSLLTGVLFCKKASPILLYSVINIIYNVCYNVMGNNPWHPTGPQLLGTNYRRSKNTAPIEYYFYNGSVCKHDGTLIAQSLSNYSDEYKKSSDIVYVCYREAWKKGCIYEKCDVDLEQVYKDSLWPKEYLDILGEFMPLDINVIMRGHFRTFHNTSKSWEKALSSCRHEVYMHTWDTVDSDTKTWYSNTGANTSKLLKEDVELLRRFDGGCVIEGQVWTEEERQAIVLARPFKTFLYYWQGIHSCINRIRRESKYILIGRYDVSVEIDFSSVSCEEDEIVIGYMYRVPSKPFAYSMTDVIFLINMKDKNKLLDIPPNILELEHKANPNYKWAEDPITDFFYTRWKKVTPKWFGTKDFTIVR